MFAVKCKDLKTTGDVEKLMEREGFDIGDPAHWANGGDEESEWVYLYKKP